MKKLEVVYVCEDCGREFKDKSPFPEGCECGNWHEDYFRPKDQHDFDDDARGVPLFGVTYDPAVLKERNARLNVSEDETPDETSVVTIKAGNDMIKIDYGNLTKKQLRAVLIEHKHPLAEKQAKREELLSLVNETMSGGK